MKRAQYVDSGKVTAEGAMIYHRRISDKRGRPARYLKQGERYVRYVTPKAPAKVAASV